MAAFFDMPAVWGFLGAAIYASTVYVHVRWSDAPTSNNRRKRALAEFIIGVIVGPVLAEGFVPSLMHLPLLHSLDIRAVSVSVGISANYIWPRMVRALGKMVIRQIDREPPT